MSELLRRPSTLGALCLLAVALAGSSCASSAPPASKSEPLEEFGLTRAQLAERIEATERNISACMTSAGFSYVAMDFDTIKKAMDSDQSAPGLSGEEYVKQFGLGVTTQVNGPITSFAAGPQNNATLQGLPTSDQVAYRRTLWGENPDWNHAQAVESEDFSPAGGCTRTAADALYQPSELTGAYVNPADKRLEQDPRFIAALAQWSECIRKEGYDYDHPDRIIEALQQRFDALTQGQDPSTLTGVSAEALSELQGEERAIAIAHVACQEAHIESVESAIEAEFYGGSPT